ncbi:PDZ and LIM domain protein 2 isoform X2 [Apteryx mantelli]|uniref:PDZ and LIM domain protein 2 n=1 Tax=Apteryx mantelli TaxID=2696672 RepID=A0ABM4FTZ7_9AVES
MSVTVTLAGPAPWGFRITGGRDFRKPIAVSQVAERGKAAAGGLRPGDVIVSINGESAAEMLNVEAQNKIKQSRGQLRLQVERSPAPSPGHTNGESCPERLAARFQEAVRTREESRGCLRSSYSSPASLSPRPGSPGSPGSPGPGAADGRGEPGAGGRSSPPGAPEDLSPLGLPQERSSRGRRSSSPGPVLLPSNRPPSPGVWTPPSHWAMPGRASPSRDHRNSLGAEPAMRRFEEDSEVYKMLQENRELRAAPRQSNTFRLLQEALEDGGADGPAAPFPSRLSPGARQPPAGAAAGLQKLHACEKCGGTIATQAVRIQDGRYRHPSCYACSDCGLNLKMRGHFWAGDELYCEKHARLRYRGPPAGPAAPRAPPS